MNIRYKSLTIRDATAADSVQLAAWWNSGRIMAHAGFPNGLKTTAEKIASDISSSTGCHRLILEQYGKPIGEASYRTVPAEANSPALLPPLPKSESKFATLQNRSRVWEKSF